MSEQQDCFRAVRRIRQQSRIAAGKNDLPRNAGMSEEISHR